MRNTFYVTATVNDKENKNKMVVKDIDGCTNLGCLAINGNSLYCIKTNSDGTKAYLYKFTGSGREWTQAGSAKKISGSVHVANGMTYYKNPSNGEEALYVAGNTSASDRKLVKLSLNGKVLRSYSCASAGRFGAITAYKNGAFLAMANDKNTTSRICVMVGTFNDTTNSFDVSATHYIKNSGYGVTQDMFYNKDAGLFIPTTERGTCRNMILQVDFDGFFVSKPGAGQDYVPVDRIALMMDSGVYNAFQIESIDLDSNNRVIGVGNLSPKTAAGSTDAIQYIINITIG